MRVLVLIIAGLFCCSPVNHTELIKEMPLANSTRQANGEALLSYTSHVTPSLTLDGMLKNQVAKEAVMIETISKEAERRGSL